MIARTLLGAQLLACAEECGSVAALAREIGVCPGSLSDLIEGGEPSMRTFRAVVAYMGVGADHVLRCMDLGADDDDGPRDLGGLEPPAAPSPKPREWTPDASVGGKARQAGLCDSCGSRLSREAALARWAAEREAAARQQMTLTEVG